MTRPKYLLKLHLTGEIDYKITFFNNRYKQIEI